MKKLIIYILLASCIAPAALARPADDDHRKVAMFFPDIAGGGRLRLFSSGALIFNGNGWATFDPGPIFLQFRWVDCQYEAKQVIQSWSIKLGGGRYFVGVERTGDELAFTVTREHDKAPFLRSGKFPIKYYRIDSEF